MLLIDKNLTKKIKYIANHFEEWSAKEQIGQEQFIWFVEFSEPDLSYEFNDSRMGVSNKGKFIWQATSGCSCPTPYEDGLDEGDYYDISETINLGTVNTDKFGQGYLDKDWSQQLSEAVERMYLAIKSPNKLTGEQILGEKNAEFRRVLIEKVGVENFIKKTNPTILDESEVGSLLKITLEGDEPIILLKVKDASTPREYLLRVPPNIKTASQAKAWTFGFEEADFILEKET